MFVKIVIHPGGKIRQCAAFQVRIIQIFESNTKGTGRYVSPVPFNEMLLSPVSVFLSGRLYRPPVPMWSRVCALSNGL